MKRSVRSCGEGRAALLLGISHGFALATERIRSWRDKRRADVEMLCCEILFGRRSPERFCEVSRFDWGKIATAIIEKNCDGDAGPCRADHQVHAPIASHIRWCYEEATEWSRQLQKMASAL